MLYDLFRRFIFYISITGLSVAIFYWLDFKVDGASAGSVFFYVAIFSGLIQAANIAIFSKISDIHGIKNIGVWAKWRLESRIELRRKAALFRSLVGVSAAVITGILSGWMRSLGPCEVSFLVLGIASAISAIAILINLLTVYEFFYLSKLETDLRIRSNESEIREKNLKTMKGKSESESDGD